MGLMIFGRLKYVLLRH